MFVGFSTIPYLAPAVEGEDVVQPLTAPPPASLIRPDRDAALVFLPERRGELELVRQTFPNGELEMVPSPLGGAPLFFIYRVQRSQLPRPGG
jgi:hypothetical protein